jgi:hypothetical protein
MAVAVAFGVTVRPSFFSRSLAVARRASGPQARHPVYRRVQSHALNKRKARGMEQPPAS